MCSLQGLWSWAWRFARGGLLLLLVGRPGQLVYSTELRIWLTVVQYLMLLALAAAPVGAAAMVHMGAPLGLAYSFAMLTWAATCFVSLSSVPERIEADVAKLQAAKATLRGQVAGERQLAGQLSNRKLQGAVAAQADAAAVALENLKRPQ